MPPRWVCPTAFHPSPLTSSPNHPPSLCFYLAVRRQVSLVGVTLGDGHWWLAKWKGWWGTRKDRHRRELESEASFLLLLVKAFGRPWLPLGGPRTRFPLGEGDVEAGSLPSWRGGATCQHLPGNRSSPRPVLGGSGASQTNGQVVEENLGFGISLALNSALPSPRAEGCSLHPLPYFCICISKITLPRVLVRMAWDGPMTKRIGSVLITVMTQRFYSPASPLEGESWIIGKILRSVLWNRSWNLGRAERGRQNGEDYAPCWLERQRTCLPVQET